MTDEREKLLQLMRRLRRQVDPAVLDRARAAALAKKPGAPPPAEPRGPLGAEAIRRFLESREDGGDFQRRLLERARQEDRARDGAPAEAPPPKPAPKKGFWRR
ncbi:MAG TPA: hypothetical protein VEH84_00660 [Alphaproteobacteria bacterium]|nr:hypothetical protein [Alphaproteobacteria bacterium]